MMKIVPAVLGKDQFSDLFESLLFSPYLHVDIMDGVFVPTRSIAVDDLPEFSHFPQHYVSVHLMVSRPLDVVEDVLRLGVKKIYVHCESCSVSDFLVCRSLCHKYRSSLYVACNPKTSLSFVANYVTIADGILVMAVTPGSYGSPYEKNTLQRVDALRSTFAGYPIELDGAGNVAHVIEAFTHDVDTYNVGSYIALDSSPIDAYAELRDIVELLHHSNIS